MITRIISVTCDNIAIRLHVKRKMISIAQPRRDFLLINMIQQSAKACRVVEVGIIHEIRCKKIKHW